MKVKYVIFDQMYPVLLSDASQHAEVRLTPRFDAGKPTSAGFCSFISNPNMSDGGWEVTVWGESVSLKLKADPKNDPRLIERLLESSGF
jgi:hypothetical protein